MKSNVRFGAPWAMSLKLMTILAITILGTVASVGLLVGPNDSVIWLLAMVALPLAVLIISLFFMIRGYELSGDELFVQRLGWRSRISLDGLKAGEADPTAMNRSLRLFGNGGLFCFAGKFRNKKLGTYRAFATDPKSAVVLKFGDRTIVVTPDNPKKFVARLQQSR